MKNVVVMEKMGKGYVENAKSVRKMFPEAVVLDVTSGGAMECLDPEYELGDVEIPGMKEKGLSILGVWEGMKVFSRKEDVDLGFMKNKNSLGKVRNCKSYGKLVGLKVGDELVREEGKMKDVLENIYKRNIERRYERMLRGLRKTLENRNVVLLDYKEKERKGMISHAEIIKEMIERA